jgi:hypothetical protein
LTDTAPSSTAMVSTSPETVVKVKPSTKSDE